jgi:hypothetical protein
MTVCLEEVPEVLPSPTRRPTGAGYSHTSTLSGDDDGPAEVDAYVLSRDHGRWRNGSGSERDWDKAGALRSRMADEPLFWFRGGSQRYLVTDPDLLRQLAELGRTQERVARRLAGELGSLTREAIARGLDRRLHC